MADLVILCVPVGSMNSAARSVAEHLRPQTLVSDVGSSKAAVAALLREALPHARIMPAHPVAGNENSGPESGVPDLFNDRWCVLTPDADARSEDVAKLSMFSTGALALFHADTRRSPHIGGLDPAIC